MLEINNLIINTLFLYLIVLNFFLSFFILFRHPKKKINQSFSLLCFNLSIWILSLYASQRLKINTIVWQRVSFFSQLIIILDAWYLSFIYPIKEDLLKNAALIFGTAFFLCSSFLLFLTPFWINSQGALGSGFLLFISFSWIPIAWTFLNFYNKLPKTRGLEKLQLKYLFIAYFFWIFCSSFLAPLFNIKANYAAQFSLSGLGSLIFSLSIFYAIARYKLLDIRFMVAKAITYGVLTLIITIIYTFFLYVAGLYFYQAQLSNFSLIVSLSLTILISITILPIKKALENITNRTILKDKIMQNEGLSKFANLFFTSTSLSSLINNFCTELQNILKVEFIKFIFIQNGNIKFFPENNKKVLDTNDTQMILDSKNYTFTVDDELDGNIKEVLRKSNAYYCKKYYKESYAGIFLLGYKLNGDIYYEDERSFLKILLSQFFITLEKTVIFDKLKEFNRTLEKRVDKATANLQNTNLELTKNIKHKDELISIISHELIVPMVAIAGSLSTVIEGLTGKILLKTKDFLTSVYNENARLIRLTRNLLNVSQIKTHQLHFTFEQFNPKGIIEQVFSLMKTFADEKKLTLKVSVKSDSIKVAADRDRLKEILINLTDNSIKYTNKGFVEIGYNKSQKGVNFFVKDSGPGMSQEKQDEITPYLDILNESNILTKKGRGMGLYICYNLIKGMHGEMNIESKKNRGTVINFWLPEAK